MDGVANTLGHEMTAVFVGITLGIFINPQNRTTAMNGLGHNGEEINTEGMNTLRGGSSVHATHHSRQRQ